MQIQKHYRSSSVPFVFVAAVAFFVIAHAASLKADDADPYTEEAKAVEIFGGPITCLNIDVSSSRTGDVLCRDFKPPSKFAVGEKYHVGGKERMIGKVEIKRALQKGSFWEGNKIVPVGCTATEFTTKDLQPYSILSVERCQKNYPAR